MAVPKDVIVIGAGIVGCAVAFELTRRGASVRVLDDRPAGMGATQASAGILAPYIEAHQGGALLDLTARGLALFDGFVADVAQGSGLDVPYRRTGTINVALLDDTMQDFRAVAVELTRRGVSAELLDAAAVRRMEPHLTTEALGGLLIPCHGFVSAMTLTRATAVAAEKRGARLVIEGRVRRVLRDERSPDGAIRVDTDGGSHTAAAVVLAAGCWSSQIEVEGVATTVPVRPVRGQLLHLAWSGRPLARVTWGERCYLVPWEDGTLLVGATVEEAGFDERTTSAGVKDLIEAACELVPHGWTAAFEAARAGLRPATADGLPVIGLSSAVPGLMYATAHYRNGVLLAPLTAQLVADAVLEGRIDPMLDAVRPQRFGFV